MMTPTNDPRVYFAAERTLLAWIRTSLALMGFGFVVARFGLFLRMLAGQSADVGHQWASTALGVLLVAAGVIAVSAAAWQFSAFERTLAAHERPRRYWAGFALAFALGLAVIGTLVAAYLLLWMHGPVAAPAGP